MIGILLVCHSPLASALTMVVHHVLGKTPEHYHAVDVPADCDHDRLKADLLEKIAVLNQGQGVLILSDLIGATPHNLATQIMFEQTKLITNINVAGILRALSYRHTPLNMMSDTLCQGGPCQLQ